MSLYNNISNRELPALLHSSYEENGGNIEKVAHDIETIDIMLGVMNLLPIPGLDGGHILFTLYEMVTRRKPSDRFMVVAQMVGMFLLFALMFLAFGNDIARLIK